MVQKFLCQFADASEVNGSALFGDDRVDQFGPCPNEFWVTGSKDGGTGTVHTLPLQIPQYLLCLLRGYLVEESNKQSRHRATLVTRARGLNKMSPETSPNTSQILAPMG